jgi:hypothetical protein
MMESIFLILLSYEGKSHGSESAHGLGLHYFQDVYLY